MMYNQKRSAKRRMRALALLPALGAAVLTANLPAVASVMSEASAAELFSQSAEPTASASKVTKTSANPADDSKVYDVVEQMPEFPGGMKAMLDYLGANLKYPAGQECAQGRVAVKFVINKDGSVGDTEIIKSLGEAFDAEAVRVVKSMPRFTPGMLNGKPVAVYYVLPVNFKLDKPAKESPKQTNSTTITINKAAADNQSAVNINPMPDNPIVKVNGEEIPYDQLASIPSSSITSMQIDKKSGDRPVILITTK